MTRPVIGVLRGGTSHEYDLSLKSGAATLAALREDTYDVRDIFIDKKGSWHAFGKQADPARALAGVDGVVSALHGGIGEDGSVARMLERLGIPYAGSKPGPLALSLSKVATRRVLASSGVRMPSALSFSSDNGLDVDEMARFVFSQFGPPYIVKPVTGGASFGVRYVAAYPDLASAIADALEMFDSALVEEYVIGEEATVGLVDGFRGESLYAFPPAYVERGGMRHLEFSHHLQGQLRHQAPSAFSHAEKEALIECARRAHATLGLSHMSRADMILTKRGPYLLEVNAIPGLYPGSGMAAMLEAVGSSTPEYVMHQIQLARAGA